MKPDKRKTWTHRGCKIVPVSTQELPTRGKGAEAFRGLNFYWRIEFPKNSGWVLGPDKSWCEAFISSTAWLRDYK